MLRLVRILFMIMAILILMVPQLYAIGKLYGRIPWLENSPIYNLNIKSFHVKATIIDQLVTTTVVQEFTNDSWRLLEGIFVYDLPEGAKITSLALWKRGEKIEYSLKTIEEASEVYQEIVTRKDDVLFPENEKANVFRLRLFPVDAQADCKIEFSYFHQLLTSASSPEYFFPMDISGYTEVPIQEGSLEINLSSQFRLYDIQAPLAQINQQAINNWQIVYQCQNSILTDDFVLNYKIDRQGKFFNLLTHTPSPTDQEDSYYALWITAPNSFFIDTIAVKEIAFVVDHSATMRGTRLNQLKDALKFYIDELDSTSRFNIIAFSTDAKRFRSTFVTAKAKMKQAAKDFVTQLSADALRNTEAGLTNALELKYTDWTRRAIIFFTDGKPNFGVKEPAAILQRVTEKNSADVSIFPVGIGNEIDISFLRSLALQNKGFSYILADDEQLLMKLQELYPQVQVPALTTISLDYGTIQTLDIFPRQVNNMVSDVQQPILGRYIGEAAVNLKLTGSVNQKPILLTQMADFVSNNNFLIAQLWAASKIDYYDNLIQQFGSVPDLVEAIVNFSEQYRILTPYTAFLLIEPGAGIPSDIPEENILSLPQTCQLLQNFPNPFNPNTTIGYSITGQKRHVKLLIYDTLGKRVTTLIDQEQTPGEYQITWFGNNFEGLPVQSGLYFYRLEVDGFTINKKMILLK
ncbi:VWA domain-containing protein [candidate division KSB1 bacterium]|nr:VWA domain-containing protein [candidate division KSB1 bacterium]